jgi:cyclase
MFKRIIACLDIKDKRVVKGVNFAGLRDMGNPLEMAVDYNAQGADEIVLLDIAATAKSREFMLETLIEIRKLISAPITVGGGINSPQVIAKYLGAGADKVAINSAAVKRKEFVEEIAKTFSRKKIVIAIDAKFDPIKGYSVYVDAGKTDAGIEVVGWAKEMQALGAGEILLTSMNADGTRDGYDTRLTGMVGEALDIPVVASGGCGALQHFRDVFENTPASGALAAGIFHSGELTVAQVKDYLASLNIPIRRWL